MKHVPAALAAAILAGCAAGPKTPTDVIEAGQLERGDGARDEEALAAWRRVGERACANHSADLKDDCGVAKLREAQILERLGRPREAEAAFEEAAARAADPRNAARALERAASLLADPLGDEARASALAWRCVEEHPDDLGADKALALAVRLDRRRDPRALRDRLDALVPRLETHDLVDNARYEAARLTAEDLHDTPGAVARFDDLAARHRRSSLRDDALWRAAHLLRARGDLAGAIERLQRLVATRRRALITGSYNSEHLDDAQLLVGRIQLDELHDPAAAARSFAALADWRDTILADDALLELARAREAQGDRAGACAALDRLIKRFPDGNRVRAARARQGELACPRGESR